MKTMSFLALAIPAFMLVAGAQAQPPALPPGHPSLSVAAAPEPVWSPPTNWNAAPPSPMVVRSFSIAGEPGQSARVAVSAFPGDVGGTFQNVNRWRAQIGLPPLPESEIASVTQSIEVSGGKATLVDLTNPDGKPPRLTAVIVPRGTNTWFYKLSGDAPLVEREKPAFLKFVQTVVYPQP
jgi:hypothetical protein